MDDYRKYRGLLDSLAEKFRCSDRYFSTLPFEHKKMLNDVGKILGDITYLLVLYDHSDDEELKREIRVMFSDIQGYVNKSKGENES